MFSAISADTVPYGMFFIEMHHYWNLEKSIPVLWRLPIIDDISVYSEYRVLKKCDFSSYTDTSLMKLLFEGSTQIIFAENFLISEIQRSTNIYFFSYIFPYYLSVGMTQLPYLHTFLVLISQHIYFIVKVVFFPVST